MGEWKRVARSDESRFFIHHVDGRVRVRRLPGEQLLPSCTAAHTQAGGGVQKVMAAFGTLHSEANTISSQLSTGYMPRKANMWKLLQFV
ncbi:hypothetical protein AVEN_58292-1 [Araneus ventricosus]|uniref:Uncharacterized protein n=1 Tax=Araneus ventricosus TaxID=182803 RepID=A0A4Y2L814_ARAVE|nr:hypothetical protein AVEN_58292-1 [Araneus ventricosus]